MQQTGINASVLSAAELYDVSRLDKDGIRLLTACGVLETFGSDNGLIYRYRDEQSFRLCVAAVKLGFDAPALAELLELYDHTPREHRALPRFMKLLARYARVLRQDLQCNVPDRDRSVSGRGF